VRQSALNRIVAALEILDDDQETATGKGSSAVNSKLVLILLQGARWCIQHARGRLEHRLGSGWDRTLSLRLDQLLTIEDLLAHSLGDERAA
jgi:hypothetical protein